MELPPFFFPISPELCFTCPETAAPSEDGQGRGHARKNNYMKELATQNGRNLGGGSLCSYQGDPMLNLRYLRIINK